MKKLLLIISMLAVLFSMAGCTESEEKSFEYNESALISYTEQFVGQYLDMSDEEVKYYLTNGTDIEKSAAKGFSQTKNTDGITSYGDFDTSKAVVTDNGTNVSVSVYNQAKERNVEITVIFKENTGYDFKSQELRKQLRDTITMYQQSNGVSEEEILAQFGYYSFEDAVIGELSASGILPFEVTEMEVNAVYSDSEMMKQAGMNTLLGMGTVFSVLIFISFIISLFKFLPNPDKKKAKAKEQITETKASVVATEPVVAENLMNDGELVAVITAAIQAAYSTNDTTSNDKLVVRSIKRAKR